MRSIKYLTVASMLVLTAALAAPAWAGGIRGVVKPQGLRTPEGIVVYVANAPAVPGDLTKGNYVMDQQNLTFIPHVLPVPVGATVHFPNNDKVDHNVFSLSQAKKFNMGSYKPGQGIKVTFDQPGVVELRCDVHQEMSAYILVLKTPYFAVTDAQGRFSIPDAAYWRSVGMEGVPDLPAGKYLLKTWHEKLSGARVEVEAPASGEAQVELTPKRGAPGVLYKR